MRKRLYYIYLILLAAAVAHLILQYGGQIAEACGAISTLHIATTVTICALALLLQAFIWRTVQLTVSKSEKLTTSTWLYFFMLGYIGRYLPGKIGMIVGRIPVMKAYNFSGASVVYSSILDLLFTISAAMLLTSLYFFNLNPTLSTTLLIAIGIALLSPGLFTRAAAWLAKRSEIDLTHLRQPSPSKRVLLLSLACGYQCLYGIAFAIVLHAIHPFEYSQLIMPLIGAYAIGILAGILSIIAPSGIGVREGVTTGLLLPVAPAEEILAATLALRGMIIVSELIVFSLSAVLSRRN